MRPITIAVGYTWAEGSTQADARWTAISRFAKAAAESGRNSAMATLTSSVSAEDDEPRNAGEVVLPRVTVTRLRAGAGRFTWDSISERIREAQILIFDVSPVLKPSKATPHTSDNVWLELGFALGLPGKDVFVVHGAKDGYKSAVPSDLAGLLIGHIPDDARAVDKSLRAGLAGAVRRSVLATMSDNGVIAADASDQRAKRQRTRTARST
jgi:hypothetical protein